VDDEERVRPELQDIVEEAARLLDQPTTLEDRQFNLIAFAAQHSLLDAVRQNSILQRRQPSEVQLWFEQFGIADSLVPVRTPADPEQGILPRTCFPVRWRAVTYGYIWSLGEPRTIADPAVQRVMELAEHAGAYLYQIDRQQEDQSLAVADLLASDSEVVRRSALRIADQGLLAWDEPVVCVIVGAWNPGPTEPVTVNLTHLPKHVLADRGHSSTTMLLTVADVDDRQPLHALAQSVIQLYQQRLPAGPGSRVVTGIGGVKANLTQSRSSWMEAKIAARVAASSVSPHDIEDFADLGTYRLIASAPDPDLYEALMDRAVAKLFAGADDTLPVTMLAYLDRAGRVTDTARHLKIHRQTLYYRIQRTQQITGLDLDDGRHRTRLHAALMLAPLLRPPAIQ
jgi:hypothetical protein